MRVGHQRPLPTLLARNKPETLSVPRRVSRPRRVRHAPPRARAAAQTGNQGRHGWGAAGPGLGAPSGAAPARDRPGLRPPLRPPAGVTPALAALHLQVGWTPPAAAAAASRCKASGFCRRQGSLPACPESQSRRPEGAAPAERPDPCLLGSRRRIFAALLARTGSPEEKRPPPRRRARVRRVGPSAGGEPLRDVGGAARRGARAD